MSSTKSSDWTEKMRSLIERAGRMELLTAAIGADRIQWENERQQRMIRAEDDAVANELQWPLPADDDEDEAMRQTIVGDVTQPAPIVVSGQSSGLGPLAAMALGMAFPGVGAAGYLAAGFLADKAVPAATESVDETINLGLRTIEELEAP